MADADFLHIFLDEALDILERIELRCLDLEKSVTPDLLNELFRYAHNLKGSSRSVGLDQYGQFVHRLEDLFTTLKADPQRIKSSTISIILKVQSNLVEWTEKLRQDEHASHDIQNLMDEMEKEIHPDRGEKVSAPELAFGLFDEDPVAPTKIATAPQVKPQSPVLKNPSPHEGKSSAEETLRVSTRRLDSLIRLIGELSIQYSIVANAKDNHALDSQQSLDAINLTKKVIQDLQSEAMGLRLQPLDSLFQRLERTARDVARTQGKPIEVILQGSDVELDKTVIERMKDPLVHIIRNAVDHGIETPDQRMTMEKTEKGRIVIEGRQNSGNVIIRISDNGRGLDPAKIMKKALERSLIQPGTELSEDEIFHLIFQPGFSTAEKITDVSGRGVGMDVVNKAVGDLNGSIAIESTLHQGSCFEISLPSTLSILDAIIVQLGQLKYAIPVQDIEEVVDLSTVTIETTSQQGRVLDLRGQILPVERLADYLPKNTFFDQQENSRRSSAIALITDVHKVAVAFEVDGILGQQTIVVRKLEGNLADVPGFSGGTILASGEPSMILQLGQFVRSYLAQVA